VLVVDDNDVAAWGIGKLLELRGCRVEYAYKGEDGIRKALSRSPAAVILDIGLPDMNGEEVAAVLRNRGYAGRIVALSGFTVKEAKVKKSDQLFDAYLVKPAGLAELEEALPDLF
jgi:DNA-binding response OmpR family regulator